MASNVCVQLQGDKAEVQNSALILGWAVEALQTCFLVADDIMDQSITRRGSPCWYRNKNVGLAAINDTLAIGNPSAFKPDLHLFLQTYR